MPVVNMPDGQPVSFPDTMAPDQIRSLILSKFPDAASQAKTGTSTYTIKAPDGNSYSIAGPAGAGWAIKQVP